MDRGNGYLFKMLCNTSFKVFLLKKIFFVLRFCERKKKFLRFIQTSHGFVRVFCCCCCCCCCGLILLSRIIVLWSIYIDVCTIRSVSCRLKKYLLAWRKCIFWKKNIKKSLEKLEKKIWHLRKHNIFLEIYV